MFCPTSDMTLTTYNNDKQCFNSWDCTSGSWQCWARGDKTGPDSVTSFWSSQSVFLIGPHTPATLGCRPGSNVWTNQKKVVKKSFPSSSNISKPNSAPKRCERIGAGFIATWGPWWFPSCHDAVISRKDPRSNVPAPATTSHQMNK